MSEAGARAQALAERVPRHLLVAASAWLNYGITAAVQLLSIRILLTHLSSEQYAAFAVLSSLRGWYLLADMGVGASLQNHISESRAHGQPYGRYVGVAGRVGLILMVAGVALLAVCSPSLAGLLLGPFGSVGLHDRRWGFFLVGVLCVVATVCGMAYKVWYGEHRGFLANLAAAAGSVGGLAGLWLLVRHPVDWKLSAAVLGFFVPPALLAAIAYTRQIIRSSVHEAGRGTVRPLILRALQFWAFGLLAAAVLQVDYLVMSRFLGAHDIIIYNVGTRLFGVLTMAYSALLFALWPVCAESIARKRWDAPLRYVRRYLLIGAALTIGGTALLAVAMPQIVALLSPSAPIVVPTPFILLLGVYQLVRVWSDTFAMVLQSVSDLRPFWLLVPAQAVASVTAQTLLGSRYGIYGVVMGLICSFALTVAWGLPLAVARLVRRDRATHS